MSVERIEYKAIKEGAPLALHVFRPDRKISAGANGLGVLFFHGGGWNSGSADQFFPQCEVLRSRGYLALSADYRVKEKHGTDPKASLADARACVRWTVAHASELGLNADRLVLAGGSAGGHLALMNAIAGSYEGAEVDRSEDPAIAGCAVFNPVVDTGPSGYGYERVRDGFEEFSPMHALRHPPPPILIQTGTADTTTPVEGMRQFRDRVRHLGGECELVEYPGEQHGFFNYRNGSNPLYERTLNELLRFLERLLRSGKNPT